jgi:hypothetical protein
MPKISAPPFTVQLFFKDEDGSGWSETWWWNGATYADTLAAWQFDTLGSILDARLALMTNKTQCTYVRVSDSTEKRDTLVKGYTGDDAKGTYTPTAGDSLPADDGLLIRLQGMEDGKPVFALKTLRALPEECVTDGKFTPTTAWGTAYDTFRTAFISQGRIVLKKGSGVVSVTIDDVVQLHMSQRKTGRPFGLSRGRSMRP